LVFFIQKRRWSARLFPKTRNIAIILIEKFMKKLFYIFAVACIVISACTNKNDETEVLEVITVNLDSLHERFPLTSLCSFERMVPLETTEQCRIGDIRRVYIADSKFVIWDRGEKSVFVFDNNGRFICRVGNQGRAEKEYVGIDDVQVNEKEKVVSILDRGSRKILCYNLDGEFQKTIKLKESALGFAIEGNNVWLESDGLNSQSAILLKTDVESGNTLESHFPLIVDKRLFTISEKNFSVSTEGDILFASPYLYTIYKLEKGELRPFVKVNFEGRMLDDSDLMSEKYVRDVLDGNFYGHVTDVFKIRDELFFTFFKIEVEGKSLKGYNAHYNMKTKQTDIYNFSLKHDPAVPTFIGSQIKGMGKDGELVFRIDMSIQKPENLKKIQTIEGLEDCTNDSNPVLVLYRVKE